MERLFPALWGQEVKLVRLVFFLKAGVQVNGGRGGPECVSRAFHGNSLALAEFSGVLHHCHILASEMVHFIHQMQYYITFEVCSKRPLILG